MRGTVSGRWFVDAYAFAVGLAVGSYLNVVIHRLPRGISTVTPRSRCPSCGSPSALWDNQPLVSFLRLRGRCRRCAAPISWRYPVVEGVTGGLFALSADRFGASAETAVAALFCSLLIVLAAIDVEHFLLPDRIVFPGLVAGLALQRWIPRTSLLEALAGTFLGAGVLALVINVWYWLRGEEGMGPGDVNMLAMVGAFLGWQGVVVTLVVGSLAGAAAGLALVAAGRAHLKSRLPFGLFLAAGAAVALFAGEALLGSYVGLL